MKIAVIGLGYVGLPLSLQFACSGVTVLGLDIDTAKVAALKDRQKTLKDSSVLVLGLAYKPNVDDERESPAYVLMDLLKSQGAHVAYHDPHIPVIKRTREHPHWAGTESVPLTRENLESFLLVLICTNHAAVDYKALSDGPWLVVDTRNAMAKIPTSPGQVWKA